MTRLKFAREPIAKGTKKYNVCVCVCVGKKEKHARCKTESMI